MGYCWAVVCNHHNQRDKCKFCTLPKDTKSRNRWLKLLRRSGQPGRGCVVCSCHFKNGLRINGPELQEHLKKAIDNEFPPPPQKIRNQKTKKLTIIPTADIPPCNYMNKENALDVDKSVLVLPTQSIPSVTVLETENYLLKKENEELKSKMYKLSFAFSYETICNSD